MPAYMTVVRDEHVRDEAATAEHQRMDGLTAADRRAFVRGL